jgi:hypothetical protein
MLQTVLLFIKKKLDQALVNGFELDESITVLNHLLQQDGSFPEKNQNKMVITLINLDHETNKAYSANHHRLRDDSFAKTQPDTLFNVTLLFTASFGDYEEALKFLNATIAFFQATPSFNSKVTPGLPKGIKALNFDIENTSFSQTHNLWSAMGAKYQPSIIYKVRHVAVKCDQLEGVIPAVVGIDTGLSPKAVQGANA